MAEVSIRYREVIARKPQYGRYGEHQVVQGRKILSRHDLESQARRWCEANGHSIKGGQFNPPDSCRHPNSSHRHNECMYLGCPAFISEDGT